METAFVFQYGNRENDYEVQLPSYVEVTYEVLKKGRVVAITSTHQLSPGESCGVGSAGTYRVYRGVSQIDTEAAEWKQNA